MHGLAPQSAPCDIIVVCRLRRKTRHFESLSLGLHGFRIAVEHSLAVAHRECVAARGVFVAHIGPSDRERLVRDVACLVHGNTVDGAALQCHSRLSLSGSHDERGRVSARRGRLVGHRHLRAAVGSLGAQARGRYGEGRVVGRQRHSSGGIAGLHRHRGRTRYVHAADAEVDGRLVGGAVDRRLRHAARRPLLRALVAPYVFDHLGMVDEGVAVVLMAVHHIVAVLLLLAHGVHAVPLQEQTDGPLREHGITVAGEHVAREAGDAVVVACRHIEVAAREVALVLVHGFEHRLRISRERAFAQFAQRLHRPAGGHRTAAGTFAVGVVAALTVHLAVGGIDMECIAVHRRRIVEPALGERVLAVVAVAHHLIVAACLARRPVLGRVHVPDFAVGIYVRRLVEIEQPFVGHSRVCPYGAVESRQQVLAALVLTRAVVA